MRAVRVFVVSVALLGLFLVTGAPNRRSHDHIGNFNFKVEIEGVTSSLKAVTTYYTPTAGCPIVDLDQASSIDRVEIAFDAAVAVGDEQRANMLGTLSNALVEFDKSVPLKLRDRESCSYTLPNLTSVTVWKL